VLINLWIIERNPHEDRKESSHQILLFDENIEKNSDAIGHRNCTPSFVYHGVLMQETIWNQSSLQDRALISQSKEGDHAAFETLVRKYQNHLSALVRWHAGRTTDEEDLLQRLMCKIYFSLQSFDIDRPFYPWLRRVAVNLCVDERRRLRRKALTFVELELERMGAKAERPAYVIDSYSAASRQELNDLLLTAVGMLPKRYQEIITLYYLQQRSYEEIGAILKCTSRAARIRAFRARTALRKLLEKASESYSPSQSAVDRLDACCRHNLIKSSSCGRVNGGIKEPLGAY
jgi:RNA polymerase sigma-70 factor, ECF subfamily